MRLRHTKEVTAWEIAHLGSCHLGKYPWEDAAWENTLGKMPLGKKPLEKYLTSYFKYALEYNFRVVKSIES